MGVSCLGLSFRNALSLKKGSCAGVKPSSRLKDDSEALEFLLQGATPNRVPV